jgi:hypothetical protein
MFLGSKMTAAEFAALYAGFQSPITVLDCGSKCAPYNPNGVPFCCDTNHAVPTAYPAEWEYLQKNTALWHPWESEDPQEAQDLRLQAPDGHVLIACQGHQHCQRGFRSLTCRAFPFFPYIDSRGEFIGLSYYWDYEDRCWVISNLHKVEPDYRNEFIAVYDEIFARDAQEKENFARFSADMRDDFARLKRSIPLLHRGGGAYKISSSSERLRRVEPGSLPKFGPYAVAARLPFPDEIEGGSRTPFTTAGPSS